MARTQQTHHWPPPDALRAQMAQAPPRQTGRGGLHTCAAA